MSTIPTAPFKSCMIISGKNPLIQLPRIATPDKKNKVAKTQPNPKKNSCLFDSFLSTTCEENTPLQKMIVNGLEAVNIKPCRNKL